MAFPQTRMRRLRATASLRGLVRETSLEPARLVLPLFVSESARGREAIATMPGVERLSLAAAVEEAQEAAALGIRGVMLFGVPAEKDEQGSGAWDEEGAVQLAASAIKRAQPELVVITDVCLCEYTSHGHCGVLRDDGSVDNDATVELLARTAASHARAGADIVAPSDMMDGRVGVIRAELDAACSRGRRDPRGVRAFGQRARARELPLDQPVDARAGAPEPLGRAIVAGPVPARDCGLVQHAERGEVLDEIPVLIPRPRRLLLRAPMRMRPRPRHLRDAKGRRALESERRRVCERAVKGGQRLLVALQRDALRGRVPEQICEHRRAARTTV